MKKILHVDNSSFVRKIIRNIAIEKGLQFEEAEGEKAALEILKSKDIDLIITGLELSDTSGESFISNLKKSPHARVPIIAVTSNNSLESREELFEMGVVDYILKSELSKNRLDKYFDIYLNEDSFTLQLQALNIAVLDDSKVALTAIRSIFELNNIRNVQYFQNPRELLKSQEEFSIYLVDLILPDIPGEDVVVELRKRGGDKVIIAISGIRSYKSMSQILLFGADDYIMKPFDVNLFLARMKNSVRMLSLMKDLRETKEELKKLKGL
ncbi:MULTISPECIES: response regulator [unclassified Oceanispirochaeta]|uniref:response regulator n=1 Tax=unclassified Oceanispirochaeta TaxID=2635722 RepID=UPI000E099635|nr:MULTISPECIES: response regulator [unclassified Oceanispirochaeta]MBF9017025.1 response regulator [Oceanispirochaeta sp. M2]NPD73474.1 response regulator [Oceanispirochaeta sp. M1]RDG30766.1 response regulator [Oceanispirochaeta sp. M1]